MRICIQDHTPLIPVPVLMYHGVIDGTAGVLNFPLFVSTRRFYAHMKILMRLGYRSVSMRELAQWLNSGIPPTKKSTVLTFDDGFQDNYHNVLPLLTKYGFVGNFFVVVHRIGGRGEWSPKINAPLMTWDQIREMHQAGMEIGSHSLTHPHLTRLPRKERVKEIGDSRKILEDRLGVPVHSFCYPYGDFNNEVEHDVQEAGYTCACTVNRGNRHRLQDRFKIRRIPMHQGVSSLRLAYRTSVLYHWEQALKGLWRHTASSEDRHTGIS